MFSEEKFSAVAGIGVSPMDSLGTIVFLDRDEHGSALFFQDILFDPAALWLSETLRQSGVERFLVVCDESQQEAAAACFPQGTGFVTDLGMTGPVRTVLGIKPENSLNLFLGGLPRRYEEAEGNCKLNACLFTIDTETKKCVAVRRTDVEE